MEIIPKKEPLYFISADKDFSSDLDENMFSLFLSKEMYNKKKSKVVYYSSISGFLKKEFEDETITKKEIEQEKSALPKPAKVYYSPILSRDDIRPVDRTDFVSGAAVVSGTDFVSGAITTAVSREEEIRCSKCDKMFYVDKGSLRKTCPHCGHAHTTYIGSRTYFGDPSDSSGYKWW